MKVGSYQISEKTSPMRQSSKKRNGATKKFITGALDITVSPHVEGGQSTKRKRRN